MNTSVRARHDARGFSFVELLVTIIIAGIVFAALVPVFVMAAKKSGQDNSRNIAVNVAQGQLEKIRGLQYDQILADSTHLNDPTFAFANGQFRTPYIEYVTAAGTKKYWVKYDVDLYPPKTLDPSTGVLVDTIAGEEDYKQVQVRVSWAPSEATITPENSVTLRTIIYKQYAGPGIISPPRIVAPTLVSSKTSFDGKVEYPNCVTGRAMTIEVDVDPNKLPTTLKVIVGIYAVTGELIAQIPDAQVVRFGTLNQWRATWTAPTAVNDGAYVIRAVAMSSSRYLGNNASTEFQLDLGAPGDVTGIWAWPGDRLVQLDWVRPPAADVDHYEIYRSLTSTFGSVPEQPRWVWEGYTDPQPDGAELTTDTQYYYKVVAVDIFDQKSLGAVASAIPTPNLDVTAPYPPSNLLWSASGLTITLSWTASPGDVNEGTVSGLGDYYLYQAPALAGPWTGIWHGAAIIQPVTLAAYDKTMYYKLTAKDNALKESAPTNTVTAKSGSAPRFDLLVRNSLTQDRYVRVHSSSINGTLNLVGTNKTWLKVGHGQTNSINWSNLVVGKYYVEWSVSSIGANAVNDNFTQLSSAPYPFTLY